MAQELPNTNRTLEVEIEYEVDGKVQTDKCHILTTTLIVDKLRLIEPDKWFRFKVACQQERASSRLPYDRV